MYSPSAIIIVYTTSTLLTEYAIILHNIYNYILLETPLCEIGSVDDLYYLPFLNLSDDGVLTLPHIYDSQDAITLPQPLPLGIGVNVTMYKTANVSCEVITRSGQFICCKPLPKTFL